MVSRVTRLGSRVAVIGAGPVPEWSGLDPAACIARQGAEFRQCQARRSNSAPPSVHDLERSIASSRGATFLDPIPWICDADTCPAVIDHFVVYADSAGHLTSPFVRSLADRLLTAMPFPGQP
jgi:hypothetical protein